MKNQTLSNTPFQSLISFCKTKDSFRTKLALLSTFTVFSQVFDATLLFIEYMQLISQGLLLNPSFQNPIPTTSSIYGFNFLSLIVCGFSPGVCIDYRTLANSTLIVIVSILSFITFAKYILLLYACVVAKKESSGNTILLKIWSFIFKTQGRVSYYFLTSFSTKILMTLSQAKLDLGTNTNISLETLCVLIILMEFLLAFCSQTLFVYRLPVKKSFFSSKDTNTEITTLVQKFIIQVLEISTITKTLSVSWVFTSINTLGSLVRMVYLYKVLPYYKIKTLYTYTVFLTIVSCLNIAYTMETFLRSIENKDIIDENFGIITWVVITVLAIGVAMRYLNQILLRLITNEGEGVPEILVHKLIAIKHILKNNYKSGRFTTKVKWEHLLTTSLISNIRVMLKNSEINPEDLLNDKTSESTLKKALAISLENICLKRPKSSYLKLYLAYYYGKKLNHFGMSMQILTQLKRNFSSQNTTLNTAFLMRELKLNIKSYHSQSKHIDLALYMQSITAISQLKENMVEQAQLQIQLCEHLKASTSDLPVIWNLTKKLNTLSLSTKRQAKNLLKLAPKSYLEPLALYAYYSLVLNHSISKYQKYSKEYEMYYHKYDPAFNSDKLSENNAYQQGNALFVLSGQKDDLSTIVYCPQSTQRMFGRKLIGQKASLLVIPTLQNDHFQNLKTILEKGDLQAMEKSTRVFMYMQEGYMELCDYYINISPFMNQGLYYFMIVRKVPTMKEYMILNADGTVGCCTKDLASSLGLLQKQSRYKKTGVKVEEALKELGQVINSASTVVNSETNKELISSPGLDVSFGNMDECVQTTSRPLYSAKKTSWDIRDNLKLPTEFDKMSSMYSYEGKTLTIKSLNAPDKSHTYHCKVENHLYFSTNLKVLSLKKMGFGTTKTTDDNHYGVDTGTPELASPEMKLRPENKLEMSKPKGNNGDIAPQELHTKPDIVDDARSVGSYASGPLKQIKISKIFTEATKTKYYSPFYTVFLVVWYLLFAGIIVSQAELSLQRDSQLNSLNLKKKIVKSAHEQADSLITLHLYLRVLSGIMEASSDSSDIGVDPEYIYNISQPEVEVLKMQVKNLLIAVGSLKGEDVDIMFDADIKIYDPEGNDEPISMNIFHGMNQLLEEYSESLNEAKESEYSDASDLDVVFRNDLDDALLRADQIAHAFFAKARQSNAEAHEGLEVNIALTTSFVVFVAVIFLRLAYSQYKNETKNLMSFVNLDRRGVETVQQRIIEFKKDIQSESNFATFLGIDIMQYHNGIDPRNISNVIAAKAVKQNPGTSITTEYKGIAKKFWVYAIITLPLFTTIVIAILVSHLLFDRSIGSTEAKLSQVVFADDLKLNVTLMLTAVSDIAIEEDSETYLMNNMISAEVIEDLDQLPTLISEAPEQLKENGKYNPIVEDLLFRDSCLYLEDELRNECITQHSTQKAGIIRVLYDIEQYVQTTLSSIENDGELPELSAILSQDILVRAIFDSLSEELDDSFSKNIEDSEIENQVTAGITIAALILICVGAHIGILKRLGESDNEFKTILRTFPATLVLANFVIKSFLVKTSKGSMLSLKGSV